MAKIYIVSERGEFDLRGKIERGILEHSHTLVSRNYLPSNKNFDDQFKEKLKEAEVIIVLFTLNSLKEDYFKAYLNDVEDHWDKKLIIPIYLDGIKQEEAPPSFRNRIGIALENRADEYLSTAIITIINAISKFAAQKSETKPEPEPEPDVKAPEANIKLVSGDIFDQNADLLVIPCSTAGTISKSFERGLKKLHFSFTQRRASKLGTIHLEESFNSSNFRQLAFATSVHNQTSTVEAIHTLGKNLAILANAHKPNNIAVPLLGAGSGHLDPLEAYKTFTNSFSNYSSYNPNVHVVIFDKPTYDLISGNPDKASPSERNRVTDPPHSISEAKSTYFLNRALSNDVWAEKDKLGYECYAKVISEMIKEENVQTKPPLTIAILAPWGQGKTTLMRYVERNLKEDRKENLKSNQKADRSKNTATEKNTRVKDILSWLKNIPTSPEQLSYPTIWFNPWKHQNCEQIWAGMAQAIITQIVEYLPQIEQEKFWFSLNVKRMDISIFKNRVFKNIIAQFLQTVGLGLIFSSLFIFLIIFSFGILLLKKVDHAGTLEKALTGFVATIGLTVPSIINYLKSRKKILEENLKDKFTDIVTEPEYNKKAGYFQEVEKDMERVFDLLVSRNKPAVIFIDDLDRCSPDVVVEVIEAINLIINGDYRDKCYFVIGMDAQMVAASLDKKYSALSDKFGEEKKRFGDIGYYFLDKFVQLPFIIPVLKDEERKSLLADLFTKNEDLRENVELKEEQQKIITNYTKNSNSEEAEEAEKLIRENNHAKILYIKNKVQETAKDSPEIVEQLLRFGPYLGSSPRSIKRFVNMFRFYHSYQELRRLENKDYAPPRILAKWIVLSVRCPQLVRYLQWGNENKFVNSVVPLEKAIYFDDYLDTFRTKNHISNNNKPSTMTINNWSTGIDDLKIDDFSWLKEKDVLEVLLMDSSEESKLTNALKCNVW